jgi:hypothetical protein
MKEENKKPERTRMSRCQAWYLSHCPWNSQRRGRLTSPEGNAIQRDMYQYYDIYLKSALAASDEKNLSHQ